MPDDADRLRTLNDSGFPLQLAVSHLISSRSGHPWYWRVRYTEHAWRHDEANRDGFIDVVVQNRADSVCVVIECKRVRDAEWLFLTDLDRTSQRRQAKFWVSRYAGGKHHLAGWRECRSDPPSPEATFCQVRGQIDGARPMLERLASDVLTATEALGLQEKDYRWPIEAETFRVYVSLIVTTAPLLVTAYDPSRISLSDGTLRGATFTRVPFLRFRKQLAWDAGTRIKPTSAPPAEISSARESTVFIVNAEFLTNFLQEFEVDCGSVDRHLQG